MLDYSLSIEKSKKQQDILEFFRLLVLRPETLDLMVRTFLGQSIIGENQMHAERMIITAREQILGDLYLEKFSSSVDQLFSHEEIIALISFYKSDVMKKFFQNSTKISIPIFSGLMIKIQEISEMLSKENEKALNF